MNLNRRDFLKGGALIGGTAALGTMFGCAASPKGSTSGAVSTDAGLPAGTTAEDFAQSSVSLDPITAFSEEKTYDIVVVSSGIILEESNEAGILQYMQAWRKAGGYRMNPDLLKLFVDHSGETHMWMLQRSAEVDYIPSPISATKTTYDEGNFCTAVIKTYGPKPKNHTDIMALLAAAAEKQGAEFFYSTPAVQLVKDESGAITGVIGKSENDYIKFSATKAVILAEQRKHGRALLPGRRPLRPQVDEPHGRRHPARHDRRRRHVAGQPCEDHARHGCRAYAHDPHSSYGAR